MTELEKDMMEYARTKISTKRFQHVTRVVETVDRIASANGLDCHQCRLAGWLHDSAKEEPQSDFIALMEQGLIQLDPETRENPKLWHGFHAAWIGENHFGLTDPSLLDAVRYHPTGFDGLTPEGLALFVADYSEPGRPMNWTAEIRKQAESDLYSAAFRVVDEKIRYIQSRGQSPHSRSLKFREWLSGQVPPGREYQA